MRARRTVSCSNYHLYKRKSNFSFHFNAEGVEMERNILERREAPKQLLELYITDERAAKHALSRAKHSGPSQQARQHTSQAGACSRLPDVAQRL